MTLAEAYEKLDGSEYTLSIGCAQSVPRHAFSVWSNTKSFNTSDVSVMESWIEADEIGRSRIERQTRLASEIVRLRELLESGERELEKVNSEMECAR